MEYKRFDNNILLRLDIGEEIIESVLNVSKKEKITLATISGLGATNSAQVGIFNSENKKYDIHTFQGSTYEITSLIGSITTKDNEEYQHMHINLAGKDGMIVGGHLLSCKICLTAEIFINIIDGQVNREFKEELGINQIKF